MTYYKTTLDAKALLAVAGFMSTPKDNRAYLQGVFVDVERNKLVATDGHVLGSMLDCIVDYDSAETDEAEELSNIFEVSKDLLRLLKLKDAAYVVYEHDEMVKVYSTMSKTDGGEKLTLLGACIGGLVDGAFPDYTRAVPAYSDTTESPNTFFTLANFKPFIDADKAINKSDGRIRINAASREFATPMLVTMQNVKFLGVIMPSREF